MPGQIEVEEKAVDFYFNCDNPYNQFLPTLGVVPINLKSSFSHGETSSSHKPQGVEPVPSLSSCYKMWTSLQYVERCSVTCYTLWRLNAKAY